MCPNDIPDRLVHQWFGAHPTKDGSTRFCVFADRCEQISIVLPESDREELLEKTAEGFHVGTIPGVSPGDTYWVKPSGGARRPDPASRFQPDGVHGPSQVVDRDFGWTDNQWQGVDRRDLVIYELHLGAFTQQGTYLAAIDRLDELVGLGITAIELMPLAACPGGWNWGYDGVNLFAPSANYGTPNELRQFVNAAHAKGVAVIVDVVYNHLGPEGNYLSEFGNYFSSRHQTPWGDAPNFDDKEASANIRRFAIANALMWLDEYHIDGLRVDAIHCIGDDSEIHIVKQMSDAIREFSAACGRRAILIAESNVYDPEMTQPRENGGVGFDGQWCDDFVHSVFAVSQPGQHLCHREYKPTDLQQTLQYGYVYQGTLREQRGRCQPTQRVDTGGLIYCIQHHDFIGNHPTGKRLHQIAGNDFQMAAAALLFLSPAIPMMFMGEEFCCENPFQFFVDFGDENLRRAVVNGRKAEYPQHDWSSGRLPTDPETFRSSKIGSASEGNGDMRQWYQSLIALRKAWVSSDLICDSNIEIQVEQATDLYVIRYKNEAAFATVAVRLCQDADSEQMIGHGITGNQVLNSRRSVPADQIAPNHAIVFEA